MDDRPESEQVIELLRAGFAGEIEVDEVADRLAKMGVTRIGIRSVLPEGHGVN
jgi:hypothetical protein